MTATRSVFRRQPSDQIDQPIARAGPRKTRSAGSPDDGDLVQGFAAI